MKCGRFAGELASMAAPFFMQLLSIQAMFIHGFAPGSAVLGSSARLCPLLHSPPCLLRYCCSAQHSSAPTISDIWWPDQVRRRQAAIRHSRHSADSFVNVLTTLHVITISAFASTCALAAFSFWNAVWTKASIELGSGREDHGHGASKVQLYP